MRRAIGTLIQHYGTQMRLVQDGEEKTVRAFLQETRSKGSGSAELSMTPLGRIGKGVYVYMGPVTPAAAVGDTLLYGSQILQVRRAELVMAGDTALYCWGLCVEKGGDGTWGS